MHFLFVLHLYILGISSSNGWYTGPDGKIAVKGTPEHMANRYLKNIFVKYGIDIDASREMGENNLRELMANLGLGVIHIIPNTEENTIDHDDHDHHEERRRKRRSSEKPRDVTKFADSVSSIPHLHENVSSTNNNTNCRSAARLLHEYVLDKHVTEYKGIGSYEFGMLCPSLIYLIDEKTCVELEQENTDYPDSTDVWGYGILSVTVISLLSFLGAAIVPLISASIFETMLSVLVAGAVGALSGDALLHLIPHSQSSSHGHSKEPIFKNLVVLLGIYLLFVIEGLMKISHQRKQRMKRKRKKSTSVEMKINPSVNGSDGTIERKNSNDSSVYAGFGEESKGHHAVEEAHDRERKNHTYDHDHEDSKGGHGHGHDHDHGDLGDKGVASVAWMVIAGDGMHNFSDGVAIGAAFSASIVGGLSTSIAVFCHELPHELGDFAMLVKAGMTVKQALFYNGFAACLGYLGLALGILIGNYAASVTPWIFAVTAGMFLYVALVDMLPEMTSCMTSMKTKSAVAAFVLQNVGLLFGIGLMLIISIFEENFEIDE